MDKSSILNSENQGNWSFETQLTEGEQNTKKFKIYSNAIKRYSGELQLIDTEDTIDSEKDFNFSKPIFTLPEFKENFDIYNAKKYSMKIQSWQGIVTYISTNTFEAKLYDLTKGGTNEIAEFDLDDISPEDLKLLKNGATFYWSVGHFMENGQINKKSEIIFQRLITLDSDDIEETQKNIQEKYSNLKERKIDNRNS